MSLRIPSSSTVVWGVVLALAAAVLAITVWPLVQAHDAVGAFYGETRGFLWSFGFGAFVVFFLLSVLVFGVLQLSSAVVGKLQLHSAAILLERVSAKAMLFGMGLAVAAPMAMVVLAVLRFTAAPARERLDVTHLGSVRLQAPSELRNLGSHALSAPGARLVEPYLATADNVVSLQSFPAVAVFAKAIGPVSDIHLRQDTLLVVSGRDLIQVARGGKVGLVARLPREGMTLGAIALSGGEANELLLSGNIGGRGSVYELKSDRTYAKLLDVDGAVVQAAGCFEATAVALTDRVLLLRPGFRPRILMQAPAGAGPITSILGRAVTPSAYRVEGDAEDCMWMIATRDAVFAQQSGLTVTLMTGLGGNLAAVERFPPRRPDLDFTVTDPVRGTAMDVTFQPPVVPAKARRKAAARGGWR